MRSKFKDDRIVLYPPTGGQYGFNTVIFVISLLAFVVLDFDIVILPVLLGTFVAFLVALWEYLHPVVIDRHGVTANISLFWRKRIEWEDISEVVLCMTTVFGRKTGSNRVTAVGIQCSNKKRYTFAYSFESTTFYQTFIERVNEFAKREIVVDNRDSLNSNHVKGSKSTRITTGILGVVAIYIIILIVLCL